MIYIEIRKTIFFFEKLLGNNSKLTPRCAKSPDFVPVYSSSIPRCAKSPDFVPTYSDLQSTAKIVLFVKNQLVFLRPY